MSGTVGTGGDGRMTMLEGGVAVYGHLRAGIGFGTAARGTLAALRAVGIDCRGYDLDHIADGREAAADDAGQRISIVHTNPDHVARLLSSPGAAVFARAFEDRYVIGGWAWESPGSLPPRAADVAPLFDEVWPPSRFAADALAGLLPCPVIAMPHAVSVEPPAVGRDALGLPTDAFLYLVVFDEMSNLARKNPLGAVLAFRRAFPEAGGRAGLVLKARTLSAAGRRRLLDAASGRPDVILRVGDEAADRTLGLTAACDALLSLHRAEGFGLAIAEAMALGRPVIATGWSGNMEFTTADNARLVSHRPVRLAAPEGCYPAGTLWADPDLDHAARLMRELAADPDAARRLGRRAAADVREWLAPGAIGGRMRDRLAAIAADGRPRHRRRVRIGPAR